MVLSGLFCLSNPNVCPMYLLSLAVKLMAGGHVMHYLLHIFHLDTRPDSMVDIRFICTPEDLQVLLFIQQCVQGTVQSTRT